MLDQFVQKYLGKQVEFHSYNPNAKYQCVDLANQFIVEVLGLKPLIGTDAKDFPSKIDRTQFDVLEKTEDFIPKMLDIPIWSGKVGGGAGHIAVVRDNNATKSSFNSIDQNWSRKLFVTLETHSYNFVTHFLRAKIIQEVDMSKLLTYLGMPSEEAAIARLDEHLGTSNGKCDWGTDQEGRGGHLGSARRRIKQLESQPVPTPSNPHEAPIIPGRTENGLNVHVPQPNGTIYVWNYKLAERV